MIFLLNKLKEFCDTSNAIFEIKDLRNGLEQKIILNDKKFTKQKIISEDKKDPQYKNQNIDVAPPHTLVGVRKEKIQSSRGKIQKRIILKFKEINEEREMNDFYDPNGEKYKKAKQLIGRKVVTTSWEPHKFKAKFWFRNIYESKGD